MNWQRTAAAEYPRDPYPHKPKKINKHGRGHNQQSKNSSITATCNNGQELKYAACFRKAFCVCLMERCLRFLPDPFFLSVLWLRITLVLCPTNPV